MKFKLGKCIYSSKSGIKVYDNFFFRWLTLNTKAIQTATSRFCPQKPVLAYIEPFIYAVKKRRGNCCLLGLGGGGVAAALAPFRDNLCLNAVEISQEMITIARKYFSVDSFDFLKIVQDDAANFVKTSLESFEHILVDLSDSTDHFPRSCFKLDFFKNIKARLKPGGILAVNIANLTDQIKLFEMIKEVFPKATLVIPIKGCANFLVLAINFSKVIDLLEVYESNKKIKIHWDRNWGWVASPKP